MPITDNIFAKGLSNQLLLYLFLLFQILAFFAGAIQTWRVVFVACQIGSFVLLICFYRRDFLDRKTVVVLAVLLRLLYMAWLPGLSDDAFRYIWDGLVQQNGIGPFQFPPNSESLVHLQLNPIYEALNSKRYFAVYPPISQAIFYISTSVTPGDGLLHWLPSYYMIKLFRGAAELVALFLVVNMLDAKRSLLYALNPLIIVECAGQAHAESVMLLGLAIMIYGISKDRSILSVVGLLIASWCKIYPILFLPVLLRKIGYKYGLLFAALSALILFPYFSPSAIANISSSVDLYVSKFEFNAGIFYGLKKVVNWWTGRLGWGPTIGPILRTVFFASASLILLLNFRKKIDLMSSAMWISTFYLITATTIHPWYFSAILLFIPFLNPIRWEWYYLAAISTGTYLLYSHQFYWPFVVAGWVGWGVIWLLRSHEKPEEVFHD